MTSTLNTPAAGTAQTAEKDARDAAAFKLALQSPADPVAHAPAAPTKPAAIAPGPSDAKPAKTPKQPKGDTPAPENARAPAAAAPKKETKSPATQADDEEVETGSEDDEDDAEQESAYNAALKTLELDELTPEDVHGWSKKRVIAFAEKRAAIHAKLDLKASQANAQRGETTRNGAAQGDKPQGHTPLSGLQERHVKAIAALWDEDTGNAVMNAITEYAAQYTPVIENLQASLDSSEKARAKIEADVEGLRDELRLDRMYRSAVAKDSTIAEGDTWERVVKEMQAQQRTGKFKRTSKDDARLLERATALVNLDRNKTLQTDRARDQGQVQALGTGTPAETGIDRDRRAFRSATADPI